MSIKSEAKQKYKKQYNTNNYPLKTIFQLIILYIIKMPHEHANANTHAITTAATVTQSLPIIKYKSYKCCRTEMAQWRNSRS